MAGTRKVHVQRAYLVRRVQLWEVELPDDLPVKDWQEADPVAFDEHVCDAGTLLVEHTVPVNEDGLTVRIV